MRRASLSWSSHAVRTYSDHRQADPPLEICQVRQVAAAASSFAGRGHRRLVFVPFQPCHRPCAWAADPQLCLSSEGLFLEDQSQAHKEAFRSKDRVRVEKGRGNSIKAALASRMTRANRSGESRTYLPEDTASTRPMTKSRPGLIIPGRGSGSRDTEVSAQLLSDEFIIAQSKSKPIFCYYELQ